MTINELKIIRESVRLAGYMIEKIACEDYPITAFCDPDLQTMFYVLNDMALKLTEKIKNFCDETNMNN